MASRSRNLSRKLFSNIHTIYKDVLRRKKISRINQWSTPTTKQITSAREAGIFEITHIWKTGDRYYKLANKYYGNSEYWWIIASYNQKPTEGHLKIGDVIVVPTPLDTVLENL
tara:strand:+ start:116 stop:454 length:339 start_codon:yes stop_codon:yes gene_type:complete